MPYVFFFFLKEDEWVVSYNLCSYENENGEEASQIKNKQTSILSIWTQMHLLLVTGVIENSVTWPFTTGVKLCCFFPVSNKIALWVQYKICFGSNKTGLSTMRCPSFLLSFPVTGPHVMTVFSNFPMMHPLVFAKMESCKLSICSSVFPYKTPWLTDIGKKLKSFKWFEAGRGHIYIYTICRSGIRWIGFLEKKKKNNLGHQKKNLGHQKNNLGHHEIFGTPVQ